MFAQMTRYQLDGFARAYQQPVTVESDSKICRASVQAAKAQTQRWHRYLFQCERVSLQRKFLEHAFQFAGLHMAFLRIGNAFLT